MRDIAAAAGYSRRMSDQEAPLGEQLNEAIDRVRRELEILQSPSTIGAAADDRSVIADLEKELAELEDALANLGPGER
jgi:hypothetical protein